MVVLMSFQRDVALRAFLTDAVNPGVLHIPAMDAIIRR